MAKTLLAFGNITIDANKIETIFVKDDEAYVSFDSGAVFKVHNYDSFNFIHIINTFLASPDQTGLQNVDQFLQNSGMIKRSGIVLIPLDPR